MESSLSEQNGPEPLYSQVTSLWASSQLYIPLSHDVRAIRRAVAGLSFIVLKQDMFNHLALKTPENGLENVLFRETINAD